MTESPELITVELDQRTWWLVRGALMAYQEMVKHVCADLPHHMGDISEQRTQTLSRLIRAKVTIERTLAEHA
jgi:hypothetical protein